MLKLKKFAMLSILFGLLFLVACNSSELSDSTQEEPETNGDSADSAENDESATVSELPEGYPDKPIRMLVGRNAGGGTDISARTMVEALNSSGIVDQDFVVENMPGAGGALSMKENAVNGDDYTMEAVPEYGSGLWRKDVEGIDISDYKPIAQVATDYLTICVPGDSPYETIEELLDAMKEDPQSIAIGLESAVNGGVAWKWHQIADEYGIENDEMNLVAYEGGNAAMTAMLGGDIDAATVVPALAVDQIEAGNLKALAVMTDERQEERFPGVPTLKESGVDVTYYRPRGVWMSAKTSDAAADYWENAFEEMMETDVWKSYLEENGLLPIFKGRDEYTEYAIEEGSSFAEFFESVEVD